MKILFLCKRHYMGHDVIADKYARLYEQPFQLAQKGNQVLGVCLSYHPCTSIEEDHETLKGRITWIGLSPGTFRLSMFNYRTKLLAIARDFKPDIIVAASDCIHIALGEWLAKKVGSTFAADLYDDYESFGLAKVPLIKFLYRKALSRAKVISCVSISLSEYVKEHYGTKAKLLALPSTINQSIFFPHEKQAARKYFQLPEGAVIIGTAGGLSKEKGIEPVYKAFLKICAILPEVHCVLAGIPDPLCPIPQHQRIHFLGKLTHPDVAKLFSALDVGIVYIRDTLYGRLSFPQKAYEMAACKIPMVVARVGDMGRLFSNERNELYGADNESELIDAILQQIKRPNVPEIVIEDWSTQAEILNDAYAEATKSM